MNARPIVLAAGGTGGHMFPAEALARELLARGWKVALFTDRRGEAFGDRVPGISLHRVRAGRMGAGMVAKVTAVADMALGTLAAGRLLRALTPAAAVGFGGYPSLPTMLAATRQNIASILHEQNAILGRANRLLAPRVGTIAASFPNLQTSARARIVETGNPVRPEIAALRNAGYAPPDAGGPIHVLVLGGSQGARILSAIVPAALSQLDPSVRSRVAVMQQARGEDLAEVQQFYESAAIAAETAPFFNDVPARLRKAHIVIARAGASTVAELTTVGRPAILVPYRYAVDDHQTANAQALAAAGAARVIGEADFTPARLADALASWLAAPEALSRTAAASHRLGRPDAAARLADLVVAAAGGSNGHAPKPEEQAA